MKRLFPKSVLVTVAAMALAACAVPGFGDKDVAPDCPGLTILDDAETISRFASAASQDLSVLSFEARMANTAGSCTYDIEGATGPGTVDVDLNFAFEIARGPAAERDEASFAYFVGVTDQNGNILNKAQFTVRAALPPGTPRVQVEDAPVRLRIPLKEGQIGTDYHLVAGFQLNQSELEYNRRKQRPGG